MNKTIRSEPNILLRHQFSEPYINLAKLKFPISPRLKPIFGFLNIIAYIRTFDQKKKNAQIRT